LAEIVGKIKWWVRHFLGNIHKTPLSNKSKAKEWIQRQTAKLDTVKIFQHREVRSLNPKALKLGSDNTGLRNCRGLGNVKTCSEVGTLKSNSVWTVRHFHQSAIGCCQPWFSVFNRNNFAFGSVIR
jgi:hypothetical protein